MFVYSLGKFLTGIVLKLGGLKIIGKENIPEDQKIIVIANHTSFGDVPAIVQPFDYQLTFVAKEGFAKNPFTRRLFSAAGVTFLNSAESDLTAMRRVMEVLKDGRSVCIFPEGARFFDQNVREFKAGAAYIAYRTGARILPVGLLNCGDFWRIWRRNIIVNIGEPIELSQEEKLNKEYLDSCNALFRERVVTLVEENKRMIAKAGKKMRIPPKKHR